MDLLMSFKNRLNLNRVTGVAAGAIALLVLLSLSAPAATAGPVEQAWAQKNGWSLTEFVVLKSKHRAVGTSFMMKGNKVKGIGLQGLPAYMRPSLMMLTGPFEVLPRRPRDGGGVVQAVPEPGAMSLYMAGMMVVGVAQSRRRKQRLG